MKETRSPNLLALLSAAAKTAAMLGFLLPWLTIAVGSRLVVSATGIALATGEIAVRVPILGIIERHDGSPALVLILAEILMAASLGVSLVLNRRRGAGFGLVLSGLALCLVAGFVGYGIYVHMPLPPEQRDLIERVADSIIRQVVHVRSGIGFWVTFAFLTAGIALDWVNLRGSADAPQSD